MTSYQDYFNNNYINQALNIPTPQAPQPVNNPMAPTIANAKNLMQNNLVSGAGPVRTSTSNSLKTPVTNSVVAPPMGPQGPAANNSPTVDIVPGKGFSNVAAVFAAPFKGQTIAVGGKYIPGVSQALTFLTGISVVGSAAYLVGGAAELAAGGSGAAAGGAALTATGATATPTIGSLALAAGVGAGAALLLNGKPQTQTVTPSANTNPVQNPQQNITPQQITPQSQQSTVNPNVGNSGQIGTLNLNTYNNPTSLNYSMPTQNTTSYQINEQSTTSSQTTTSNQTSGIDPLLAIVGVVAALFLSNRGG